MENQNELTVLIKAQAKAGEKKGVWGYEILDREKIIAEAHEFCEDTATYLKSGNMYSRAFLQPYKEQFQLELIAWVSALEWIDGNNAGNHLTVLSNNTATVSKIEHFTKDGIIDYEDVVAYMDTQDRERYAITAQHVKKGSHPYLDAYSQELESVLWENIKSYNVLPEEEE